MTSFTEEAKRYVKVLAGAVLVLSVTQTFAEENPLDPFEGFNRTMY